MSVMDINNGMLPSEIEAASSLPYERYYLTKGGEEAIDHFSSRLSGYIDGSPTREGIEIVPMDVCMQYADRITAAESLEDIVTILEELQTQNINFVSSDNYRIFATRRLIVFIKSLLDDEHTRDVVRESIKAHGLCAPHTRVLVRTLGLRIRVMSLLTGIGAEQFLIP